MKQVCGMNRRIWLLAVILTTIVVSCWEEVSAGQSASAVQVGEETAKELALAARDFQTFVAYWAPSAQRARAELDDGSRISGEAVALARLRIGPIADLSAVLGEAAAAYIIEACGAPRRSADGDLRKIAKDCFSDIETSRIPIAPELAVLARVLAVNDQRERAKFEASVLKRERRNRALAAWVPRPDEGEVAACVRAVEVEIVKEVGGGTDAPSEAETYFKSRQRLEEQYFAQAALRTGTWLDAATRNRMPASKSTNFWSSFDVPGLSIKGAPKQLELCLAHSLGVTEENLEQRLDTPAIEDLKRCHRAVKNDDETKRRYCGKLLLQVRILENILAPKLRRLFGAALLQAEVFADVEGLHPKALEAAASHYGFDKADYGEGLAIGGRSSLLQLTDLACDLSPRARVFLGISKEACGPYLEASKGARAATEAMIEDATKAGGIAGAVRPETAEPDLCAVGSGQETNSEIDYSSAAKACVAAAKRATAKTALFQRHVRAEVERFEAATRLIDAAIKKLTHRYPGITPSSNPAFASEVLPQSKSGPIPNFLPSVTAQRAGIAFFRAALGGAAAARLYDLVGGSDAATATGHGALCRHGEFSVCELISDSTATGESRAGYSDGVRGAVELELYPHAMLRRNVGGEGAEKVAPTPVEISYKEGPGGALGRFTARILTGARVRTRRPLSMLDAPSHNGEPHEHRLIDLGATFFNVPIYLKPQLTCSWHALTTPATQTGPFDDSSDPVETDKAGEKQTRVGGECARVTARATVAAPGPDHWLPIRDRSARAVSAPARLLAELGTSRNISAREPLFEWSQNGLAMRVTLAAPTLGPLPAKAIRSATAQLDLTGGSDESWSRELRRAESSAILSIVLARLDAANEGGARPSWLEPPVGFEFVGATFTGIAPLTIDVFAHPVERPWLLTQFVKSVSTEDQNTTSRTIRAKPLLKGDALFASAASSPRLRYAWPRPPSLEEITSVANRAGSPDQVMTEALAHIHGSLFRRALLGKLGKDVNEEAMRAIRAEVDAAVRRHEIAETAPKVLARLAKQSSGLFATTAEALAQVLQSQSVNLSKVDFAEARSGLKDTQRKRLDQAFKEVQQNIDRLAVERLRKALALFAAEGGLVQIITDDNMLERCLEASPPALCAPPAHLTRMTDAHVMAKFQVPGRTESAAFAAGDDDMLSKAAQKLRKELSIATAQALESRWPSVLHSAGTAIRSLRLKKDALKHLKELLEEAGVRTDCPTNRSHCDDSFIALGDAFHSRALGVRLSGRSDAAISKLRLGAWRGGAFEGQLAAFTRRIDVKPRPLHSAAERAAEELSQRVMVVSGEAAAVRKELEALGKKGRREVAKAIDAPVVGDGIGVAAVGIDLVQRIDLGAQLQVENDEIAVVAVLNEGVLQPGDRLLGVDCDGDEVRQCFKPSSIAEAQAALERAQSNRVLVKRGGSHVATRLARRPEYRLRLAPRLTQPGGPEVALANLAVSVPAEEDTKLLEAMKQLGLEASSLDAVANRVAAAAVGKAASDRQGANPAEGLSTVIDDFTQLCERSGFLAGIPDLTARCASPRAFAEMLFGRTIPGLRAEAARIMATARKEGLPAIAELVKPAMARCIKEAETQPQALREPASAACRTLYEGFEKASGDDAAAEAAKAIANAARAVGDTIIEAQFPELSDNANLKRAAASWRSALDLAVAIEANEYRKARIEIRSADATAPGLCLAAQSAEDAVPMAVIDTRSNCEATHGTHLRSAEFLATEMLKRKLKPAQRQALAAQLDEYRDKIRSVCFSLTAQLPEPEKGYVPGAVPTECAALSSVAKDPAAAAETFVSEARKSAERRASALAQSYLTPLGLARDSAGHWCIRFDQSIFAELPKELKPIRRICAVTPARLYERLKKHAKSLLASLVNRATSPYVDPLSERVARLCSALQDLRFEGKLFGAEVRLGVETGAGCPLGEYTLTGAIKIDALKPINQNLTVKTGLKLKAAAIDVILKDGFDGKLNTKLIDIDWRELEFNRTLEEIINSELEVANDGLTLDNIEFVDSGISAKATFRPSKDWPLSVPVDLRVSRKGFMLRTESFEGVALRTYCQTISADVKKRRFKLFDGAIVTGAPAEYCVDEKGRGLHLKLEVTFDEKLGPLTVNAYLHLDKGVRIEPPSNKELAVLALFDGLDFDIIRPKAPFYNLADGLTLYFATNIVTPIDFKLQAGFLISPKRFAFNGPIGLTFPWWIDTGTFSFGQFSIELDPHPDVQSLTVSGAATLTAGEAMSRLVKQVGRGEMRLKEQELIVTGALKVFHFLEVQRSETRLNLKERFFEHSVSTGAVLADIIEIKNLMRIQDLDPNPFLVVSGKGALFGANVVRADVRLNRSFSGNFNALLTIPLTKNALNFEFVFKEWLKDPSVSGRLDIDLGLIFAGLDMDADRTGVDVQIDLRKPVKLKVGVELPLFSLLTKDYLLNLLGNRAFSPVPPGAVLFSLKPAPEGTGFSGGGGRPGPNGLKERPDDAAPEIGGATVAYKTWKFEKVSTKRCQFFGAISCKWHHRYDLRFADSESQRLAETLGIDARALNDQKMYRGHFKNDKDEEAYEYLAATGAKELYIFEKGGALIWSGSYSGGIDKVAPKIYSHRAAGRRPGGKPYPSFLLVKRGSGFSVHKNYSDIMAVSPNVAAPAIDRLVPQFARTVVEELAITRLLIGADSKISITRLSCTAALARVSNSLTLSLLTGGTAPTGGTTGCNGWSGGRIASLPVRGVKLETADVEKRLLPIGETLSDELHRSAFCRHSSKASGGTIACKGLLLVGGDTTAPWALALEDLPSADDSVSATLADALAVIASTKASESALAFLNGAKSTDLAKLEDSVAAPLLDAVFADFGGPSGAPFIAGDKALTSLSNHDARLAIDLFDRPRAIFYRQDPSQNARSYFFSVDEQTEFGCDTANFRRRQADAKEVKRALRNSAGVSLGPDKDKMAELKIKLIDALMIGTLSRKTRQELGFGGDPMMLLFRQDIFRQDKSC